MEAATIREGGRMYGGQSPAQRREERRERLIAAAVDLYGSGGFHSTPIIEVCRAARVTPRHFYELFETSEDLLLAAYDAVIAEQTERVISALEAAPERLEERIRAGVTAAAELWRDERKARLIQQEVLGVSLRVERRRTEVLRAFAELIAGEAARFSEQSITPRRMLVTGHILGGGLNEALMAWRLTPRRRRPPLSELVNDAVEVFLAALEAR